MKLAWLAAAWIAGVAAYATFDTDAWLIAAALLLATAAIAVAQRDVRLAIYALALPALFAVAIVRADAAEPRLAEDAAAHYNDGVAMRFRGVLRDDPETRDTSQRFAISIREVQLLGEWRPASGGALVRVGLLPSYRAGDVVQLEGALEEPPALDGFDYADYLARRGIQSVMQYPEVRRIGHEGLPWHREITLDVRRKLSHGLLLALPEPQASLAQGVLLGERSALPPDLIEELNVTNTSHLVVVSGSNVVLVASYVTLALAWIVGRRRAMWLSIAAVLAYATLVGLSPPVARATIMGLLLVVAQLSGRRTDGFTSIALAAALMTAHDPTAVRDVSFQLSFAATAGIASLASPLRHRIIAALAWLARRDELPRWTAPLVAEPLAVTIAAIVATTPLLALNFERVSLVAVPVNMLIVPAFPLMLCFSALAAVGGLIPHAHLALATPAYLALSYWLAVVGWFADLPAAATSIRGYSTPIAIGTYAALFAAIVAARRWLRITAVARLEESRPFSLRGVRPLAAVAVPACVLVATVGFIARPGSPDTLSVTVLDVGQGDAILIETPAGHDILVDGGPGAAVVRALGEELPWHDRSIDIVVVTHAQADHATGLLDVFDRYDVRRVITGADDQDSLVARAITDAIHDERAIHDVVTGGTTIDLGDGVLLEVLSPAVDGDTSGSANDRALVLRIAWGEVSFLLASDIEAATERGLVASGAPLGSTVLKVAHHGSATSTTREFLDAVRPAVAVISAGADNSFGHPHADVLARLDDYAETYTTATDGTVRLRTDGRRLWIETAR
ncbi:MAG: DNA internalization-related competence protein ComEC/Rec2 [Dehalococcoidia bacterium]